MEKTKYTNKTAVDIIFTGLIREHDLLKRSISDMVLLRKEGLINNIIISTWIGEPQKHPEILLFLKKNKIIILESEEPKDFGDGHIWGQMKSLEEGLNKSDYNRFILKTRTDVYIDPFFLRKLFSSKEKLLKISKDLPKGNIFRYKVWVPWFELTKPFFMGDECFFGHYHDLNLFVNYDCSYDKKYEINPDKAHVRRFIHPFLKDYPIFYDSLERYSKERYFKNTLKKLSHELYVELTKLTFLRKISEKNRFNILNRRLKEKRFIELLAIYYSILYSHFYIDSWSFPKQVVFREHSEPLFKSNGEDLERNFTKEMVRIPYGGQIYIYDMNFIDSLCEKRLNKTPLTIKFMNLIDKFNKDD